MTSGLPDLLAPRHGGSVRFGKRTIIAIPLAIQFGWQAALGGQERDAVVLSQEPPITLLPPRATRGGSRPIGVADRIRPDGRTRPLYVPGADDSTTRPMELGAYGTPAFPFRIVPRALEEPGVG